jgi:Ca2+-binding EF-hand superfamily protein
MFDRDHSGTIDLQEFQGLWNYLNQWRAVFDQFDRDRSGTIDGNELHTGIVFHFMQSLKDFLHCNSYSHAIESMLCGTLKS